MQKGTFIMLLSVCCLFASNTICQPKKNKPFRVVGYYQGTPNDVGNYEYSKLTHIIFCFVDLKGNKIALKDTIDERIVKLLVDQKRNYPTLKVMVALGGWNGCKTCSPVFSEDSNRNIFAQSVKEFVTKYHLDGFDIDWESPVIGGHNGHPSSSADKANMTSLIRTLRKALPEPYELSFDANSFPEYVLQSIDWKYVMPNVDFVNLMTYGLPNDKPGCTGHHTALYSSSFQAESVNKGVILLDSLNIPLNKIVIGAGFYGFLVQDVETMNNGLGNKGKVKSTPTYRDIVEKYTGDSFIEYWDTVAQAPFLYNSTEHIFITYDNIASVTLKTQYALNKRLGGIMFWKLNGDTYRNDLLNAIDLEVHANKQ